MIAMTTNSSMSVRCTVDTSRGKAHDHILTPLEKMRTRVTTRRVWESSARKREHHHFFATRAGDWTQDMRFFLRPIPIVVNRNYLTVYILPDRRVKTH